MKISNCKRKCS